MKPLALRVFSLALLPLIFGCGKPTGRAIQKSEPSPLRGRVFEALSYAGQFLKAPVIEHLDFGGAVLSTFTVSLSVEGDKDVLGELFWESGKNVQILVPDPKKCVPSLFGISAVGRAFELKFWAWDNVGVSTDCEDLIYAMVKKGFHIRLSNVKYADIGLVKNFEAVLKPLP